MARNGHSKADGGTKHYADVPDNTVADIAICLTILLQGVLCAQFNAHYLTLSKRDSIWLKLFVAGLALLTTLRTSQCLAFMWIQNVILFGNVQAASQMWEVHWLSKIEVMFEATAAFYVQMFSCRRLWVISRNGYILGICFVLYTFELASAAVDTFFICVNLAFAETTAAGWGALHLGVVVCGDPLLTGSTIFYLVRHSNASILSRSPFAIVINSLLRLISAAPPAICPLINFSANMRLYLAGTFIPELLMIDFIMNTILPQMYAWSALWTLNSREGIWVAVDNRPYTVSLGTVMVAPGLQVSEHESGTPHQRNRSNSQPLGKV
ncbi:hypothetical protein C8R45DRAFT_1180730 [Mycena sanguinolenta]|nr:hypothetical protein C8R45DRAFT_1180730 [Mycena sanguinolenta]